MVGAVSEVAASADGVESASSSTTSQTRKSGGDDGDGDGDGDGVHDGIMGRCVGVRNNISVCSRCCHL